MLIGEMPAVETSANKYTFFKKYAVVHIQMQYFFSTQTADVPFQAQYLDNKCYHFVQLSFKTSNSLGQRRQSKLDKNNRRRALSDVNASPFEGLKDRDWRHRPTPGLMHQYYWLLFTYNARNRPRSFFRDDYQSQRRNANKIARRNHKNDPFHLKIGLF